jgi:predicted MFS family arabinose efflux permease
MAMGGDEPAPRPPASRHGGSATAAREPIDRRAGLRLAAALALGVAVANGFSRFAYALVLPAMRADLGWGYMEAGLLNTANAAGYLVGALVTLASIRRFGARTLFSVGLWITGLALLVTGLTETMGLLAAFRFAAGVGGAAIFIAGGVLAAGIFRDDAALAARAIAVFFAGGGAGLLVSGLALPWLLAAGGDAAWPWCWYALGVGSLVAALPALWAAGRIAVPPPVRERVAWSWRPMLPLTAAYGCFAFGYMAYVTFVIAWMREHGAGALEVAIVWSVLGCATMLAPQVWSGPLAHWPGGRPLAAVMATLALGAALPLAGASLPVMLASALLYGGSLFMSPSAVTAFVKKALPAATWGEAMAAFTVFFAALQWLAPAATGYLGDLTGSLAAGLALSAVILLLGALLALLQREPRSRSREGAA